MFETISSAEIPLPAQLAPNGERLWSYAATTVHTPWFYVEYIVEYGELKSHSMLLLSNIEQLQGLTKQMDIEITQAHVVTPGHVNNTGVWKMDALLQVIRATRIVRKAEIPVLIYVLQDGRKIIYSPGGGKSKIRNHQVIFSQ